MVVTFVPDFPVCCVQKLLCMRCFDGELVLWVMQGVCSSSIPVCPSRIWTQALCADSAAAASAAVLQFHKPLLPVEGHHPLHPVVRLTAAATAQAVAAAMAPDSPQNSGRPNNHQEEMAVMSPTAMVVCS